MISWINCALSIANLILIAINLKKTIDNQEALEIIKIILKRMAEAMEEGKWK